MKKVVALLLATIIFCTMLLTSCASLQEIFDKKAEDSTNGKKQDTVVATFGEFDEINTKNSYLGYGIDIINSSSVSSQNILLAYPIFDMDKLMDEKLLKSNERYSTFEIIEADSIRGFTENMSNSSSISTGANVSVEGTVYGVNVGTSATFSNGLAKNFTKSSESVESQYFLEIISENLNYWLVLQTSESRYKEILSEEFKADLYNDSVKPADLFRKYGTHLLTSVGMGGSISMYYSMYSYDRNVSTTDYAEVSNAVQTNVKAAYGKVASVETGVQKSYTEAYTYSTKANEKNVKVQSKILCAGGGSFGINSEETLYANYYDWQKSLDQNPVVMGIKDGNSLYPIWKLLDLSVEGAQDRYNELYEYFQEYGISSFDNLCQTYDVNDTHTVIFNTGFSDIEVNTLYGIKEGHRITPPKISKTGWILKGWCTDIECQNADCDKKFDFVHDTVLTNMTLYAHWEIVDYYEEMLTSANGKRDKTITDDDGVYDLILPNFDKELLETYGLTSVRITIEFDWKALDLGTYQLWVSNDMTKANAFHYYGQETGIFWGSESDWHIKESTSFTIDISQLNDDGSFYIQWGAEGNDTDDWVLGETRVTIQVT